MRFTHPPRLFSQETKNLRTNCPRQSTMMWTVDGCPCLTQSTARAPATAYMDTTLPHVIPAVGRKHDQVKLLLLLVCGNSEAEVRRHEALNWSNDIINKPHTSCLTFAAFRHEDILKPIGWGQQQNAEYSVVEINLVVGSILSNCLKSALWEPNPNPLLSSNHCVNV